MLLALASHFLEDFTTTFCILETAVRSLHFLPSTHGCDHFFPVLKVMNTFDVGGSLFGDFMILVVSGL